MLAQEWVEPPTSILTISDVAGLQASGLLTIEGTLETINYEYEPLINNTNARTLRGFSASARDKMLECPTCPYPDFRKFYAYYGVADYADQWIMAAFTGQATSNLTNGGADFSTRINRDWSLRAGALTLMLLSHILLPASPPSLRSQNAFKRRPPT